MNPDLVEAVARACRNAAHGDQFNSGPLAVFDIDVAKAALKAHEEWLAERGIDLPAIVSEVEALDLSAPEAQPLSRTAPRDPTEPR